MDPNDKIVRTADFIPYLPDVSVGKLLLDAMEKYKDKIAHIDIHTGLEESYGELRMRSVRLAHALSAQGIRPGDVIALDIRNIRYSLVLICGALAAGAIVNPLDVMLGEDDLTHILRCTRPRIVFAEKLVAGIINQAVKNIGEDLNGERIRIVLVDEANDDGVETLKHYLKPTGCEDKFEPVPVTTPSEAVAFLLCSSGSTGAPKAVRVSHAAVPGIFVQCMPLISKDRVFTFTSPYWSSGLYITVSSCLAGAQRILTTETFSEVRFFEIMAKYEVTVAALSHILFAKIVRHPQVQNGRIDWSSKIRYIWVGGGGVPEGMIRRMDDEILPANGYVRNNYGQTEVGGAALYEGKNPKPASVGKLVSGFAGKIVDLDTNEILGRNQIGELCLKPSIKVMGYHNNPAATAELFDSTDSDPGWIRTGDVGYFDPDGFLFIVDRKKNMMRTKQMFSCTPSDLEQVLYGHPGIRSVCVVAARGRDLYDVPVAIVVLKQEGANVTESELQQLVADKLPDYKHLTGGVIFTDEIPLTPSGKLKIPVLKQWAQEYYDKKFTK